MRLSIKKMTEKYAIEVLCWKYEKPYDFYNNVLTSGAIMELITYKYFVILDDYNHIVGYFCTGKPARVPDGDEFEAYTEECIDIGVGMKPELTGKGNGSIFLSFVLQFVEERYEKDIRLTVATFNKRAIRLYENFGFREQVNFNRDGIEFVTMVKNRVK